MEKQKEYVFRNWDPKEKANSAAAPNPPPGGVQTAFASMLSGRRSCRVYQLPVAAVITAVETKYIGFLA